ncbi:MAG: DUF3126 family protein [Hyphomicrobiaceae bacterium]
MSKPTAVSQQELKRVETYMRKVFGARGIEVRGRQKAADAAEVYLGDEFLGVVSKDTEDGEVCYQFNMTILDIDLEGQG